MKVPSAAEPPLFPSMGAQLAGLHWHSLVSVTGKQVAPWGHVPISVPSHCSSPSTTLLPHTGEAFVVAVGVGVTVASVVPVSVAVAPDTGTDAAGTEDRKRRV